MNFISTSCEAGFYQREQRMSKILSSRREDKPRIFKPPCSVFLLYQIPIYKYKILSHSSSKQTMLLIVSVNYLLNLSYSLSFRFLTLKTIFFRQLF